jgi:hypothetical protein
MTHIPHRRTSTPLSGLFYIVVRDSCGDVVGGVLVMVLLVVGETRWVLLCYTDAGRGIHPFLTCIKLEKGPS